MLIVQEAAIAYKNLWNCYKTRKQLNCLNTVTKQLIVLYHYLDPKIKLYKELIN
jgi:hypothetical protein